MGRAFMVKIPGYSLRYAFVEGLLMNLESGRVGKLCCNYMAAVVARLACKSRAHNCQGHIMARPTLVPTRPIVCRGWTGTTFVARTNLI